jgi:hypothetical protein
MAGDEPTPDAPDAPHASEDVTGAPRHAKGDRADDDLAAARGEPVVRTDADEPPVVARMVVEIRSDGRRTIARGALEDLERGERVAIAAESTTPLALAGALAKALLQTPRIAGALSGAPRAARRTVRTVRALLPRSRRRER